MKTYLIDTEDHITAYQSAEATRTGEGKPFTTEVDFAAFAADRRYSRISPVELIEDARASRKIHKFQWTLRPRPEYPLVPRSVVA